MSAKFLHTSSDEHKDLQKQIGCMNGIFQLFDRHHFLSSRRIVAPNQKRLPSGRSSNQRTEHTENSSHKSTGTKLKKAVKEKQGNSTESSRSSFSSSSCSSSFSSVDCSRISQPDSAKPSFSQINFPETPCRPPLMHQSNGSLQSSRQSIDLREVVKDFIHRDARIISIKSGTKEEAGRQTLKYMDSPRPSHQTISFKGRDAGLNQSLQVLTKLRQGHWNSNERLDSSLALARKDAPRFSYDGRESRDKLKSTVKLKELPRLSLDSRERSMRSSTNEMKQSHHLGDLQRGQVNSNIILNQQQGFGSHKRSSSVVAKLMGLEAFPDSEPIIGNQPQQLRSRAQLGCDPRSQITDENKLKSLSDSPRQSQKESISPQLRIPNPIKKPNASAKFPIEPAPWKQEDGSKGPQKPALKCQEISRGSNSSVSVYGEIEERLAELEFKKSGKDLRALKQILAAMQKTEEVLETRKEEQASNFVSQPSNDRSLNLNFKSSYPKNMQSSGSISPTIKVAGSPKSFKSPVEMKPAKLLEKGSATVNPIIHTDSKSGIHRLQCGSPAGNRKEIVNQQRAKDISPRTNHLRNLGSRHLHPMNRNTGARTSQPSLLSKDPQPVTGEVNSGRSSGTVSPRLQQKKLGLEKQSRPTTPSSESSRRLKQPNSRQPINSGSPHRSTGLKSQTLQPSDDELSGISSDMRDTISIKSENSSSLVSHVDTEATSTDTSKMIDNSLVLQDGNKQQNPEARVTDEKLMAEPARAVEEQPSPISVLDAPFYEDESPSPVKKISNAFKGEAFIYDEAEWTSQNINYLPTYSRPNLSSATDHREVENIEHLTLDFIQQVDAHEVTIYNSTIPNHRYILEILLASGLIRDLESGNFTVKAHSSSCLISPKFFLALEKTKASANEENNGEKFANSQRIEKFRRALVFDVVNEVLFRKLVLEDASAQWLSPCKLAGKRPKGQQLLRDLCSEIDNLQANCSTDDEDDIFKSISDESIDWTDWQNETPGVVLDVERLIFKDLISEVVTAMAAKQPGRPRGHCRQLFSK